MTDILILYANSGFLGHKTIAENYEHLLKQSGYKVQSHDVLEVDKTHQTKFGNKLYLWGIKSVPWLWRFLYLNWERIPFTNWFRTSILPRYFSKTQKYIIEANSRLIITTHPIATSIVNYLKSSKLVTGKIFTTFSDWHIQPFWLFPQVDKYLVAISQQKDELTQIGIRLDQIAITGMLLNEVFYNPPSKKEARRQLNIPEHKKVILVMGGGLGWQVEDLIIPLSQLPSKPHIIIVGANDKRKNQIKNYINQIGLLENFSVTGFIETNIYLSATDLLISKPGGLTTSEAFLLKIPLLATAFLPGQEEANMNLLKSNNAVLKIDSNTDFVEYVEYLLNNPDYIEKITTSAYKFAPKHCRQIITNLVQKELKTKTNN